MQPELSFPECLAINYLKGIHQANSMVRVVRRDASIRWVTDDDGKSFLVFDGVYRLGFVGKGFREDSKLPDIGWWFKGVCQVDAGAFVAAEAVAGLVKFEADFHVGDGVGGHHQLVAVQAREEVFRDVVVPGGALLLFGEALLFPFSC